MMSFSLAAPPSVWFHIGIEPSLPAPLAPQMVRAMEFLVPLPDRSGVRRANAGFMLSDGPVIWTVAPDLRPGRGPARRLRVLRRELCRNICSKSGTGRTQPSNYLGGRLGMWSDPGSEARVSCDRAVHGLGRVTRGLAPPCSFPRSGPGDHDGSDPVKKASAAVSQQQQRTRIRTSS